MPIDLLVEYTDGTMESFYIPLQPDALWKRIQRLQ
jgi:hypothetical protein